MVPRHKRDKGSPPLFPRSPRPTVRLLETQGTAHVLGCLHYACPACPVEQDPCFIHTPTVDLTDVPFPFLQLAP